ncbi:MAG: hypothetical protein ABIL39_01955 [candidate division WOR-3 bacterium]
MHRIMSIKKFWFLVIIYNLVGTIGFATKYAGEFQDLIVGGRVCGMGGTGVAQGNDLSALLLNPALSPFLQRSLQFMHAENFSGVVKNEFGALVITQKNLAYGLGFQLVSVGGIKLTTLPDTTRPPGYDNQPIPYDTVATHDWVFYLNAGKTKNFFAYGLNLKFYYRDLSVLRGWGAGVDGGLRFALKNFTWGISIRDIILSPIYWESDNREYIASKIAIGGAPQIPLDQINSVLIIETDIVKDLAQDDFFLLQGIELAFRQRIYGRVGRYGERLTAGVGLRYQRLLFDYGLITHNDLGISNKFSLLVQF